MFVPVPSQFEIPESFYGVSHVSLTRLLKTSASSLEVFKCLGIIDCGDDCAINGGSPARRIPSRADSVPRRRNRYGVEDQLIVCTPAKSPPPKV